MTVTGTQPLACPRCGRPLAPLQHRGVNLDGCKSCNGTLIPIPSLTPLLDAASVDLLATFDPDAALDPVGSSEPEVACPRCGKGMEVADYCGAHLVSFDRCERCSLLWVGAAELATMTLMWARMEKRAARLRAAAEELDAELDAMTRRHARKKAMGRAMGLILFGL